jgi:hypothetical protein
MTFSSKYGYVVREFVDSFEYHNPTDTVRAYLIGNNIAHLCDESTQHRINWIASAPAGGDSFLTTSNSQRIWCQEFPQTWLREDRPTNLEYRVAASIGSSGGTPELEVRCRVVPASYPVGDTSAPALVDETATTTSATSAYIIDLFTDFDTNGVPDGLGGVWNDSFYINEDNFSPSRIALMRCEVWVTVTTTGSDLLRALRGVSIREFC